MLHSHDIDICFDIQQLLFLLALSLLCNRFPCDCVEGGKTDVVRRSDNSNDNSKNNHHRRRRRQKKPRRNNDTTTTNPQQQHHRDNPTQPGAVATKSDSLFTIGTKIYYSGSGSGSSLADRWRTLRRENHHRFHPHSHHARSPPPPPPPTTTTRTRTTVADVDTAVVVATTVVKQDVTEFRDDGFLLYLQQYEQQQQEEEEEEERNSSDNRTTREQEEESRHSCLAPPQQQQKPTQPQRQNGRYRDRQQQRQWVLRVVVGSASLVAGAWCWTTTTSGGYCGDWLSRVYTTSLWKELRRTVGAALAVNVIGVLYHQMVVVRRLSLQWPVDDSTGGNAAGAATTRHNSASGTKTAVTHVQIPKSQKKKQKKDNPWIWLIVTSSFWTRPELWYHVWETVLPTTVRTLRHMLVAELYNRAFAQLFALAGPVLIAGLVGNHHDNNNNNWDNVVENNDDDDDDENGANDKNQYRDRDGTNAWMVWMEQDRSFVAMAIKRGTKKLLQSVLQKHMNQALLYVWDHATDAIHDVVQQFFLEPAVPRGVAVVG